MNKSLLINFLIIPFLLCSCGKKEKRIPLNVDGVFLVNRCTNYFYNLGYKYATNAKGL